MRKLSRTIAKEQRQTPKKESSQLFSVEVLSQAVMDNLIGFDTEEEFKAAATDLFDELFLSIMEDSRFSNERLYTALEIAERQIIEAKARLQGEPE